MSWDRYPDYRDSGIDWIGDVPNHWDVCKTKYVADLRSGHTPSRNHPEYWENCTIPWFTLADVWQLRNGARDYLGETKEKISKLGLDNSSAQLLPKDTVILSRTASVGYSGIMPQPMATTQDFVNWVCGTRILPHYLLYVFRSMNKEFKRLTMGSTHQTIYMPDVATFSTPLPPIEEQSLIVRFIERQVDHVDSLIAKKNRLIELLNEKRAGLITQAVTKGLDPNVPLKHSGSFYWGEVPEHWRISELRYLTPTDRQIMYGIVLPGPDFDGGVPIVKGGNCEPGRLKLEHMSRTSPEIESGHVRSRLRSGDIVFAIRGSFGCAEMVPPELENSNMTQDAARVSPNADVNGRWLLLSMRSVSFFAKLDSQATGATIKGINIYDLKRAAIAVPPFEEQEKIASYLDKKNTHIQKLVTEIHRSIEKLKEYRTALISAAVTGKIDVRQEGSHD